MTVLTSATFSLDLDRLIAQAWSRIDRLIDRKQSAEELQHALECFGLLSSILDNRGTNLWTVEELTITLTAGEPALTLALDTIDILTARTYRVGRPSERIPLERWGREMYEMMPQRESTGRPLAYYVDRQRDAPVLRFWPVPEAGYVLEYTRVRRMRDSSSLADGLDVPVRWQPALVSGLTYLIADGTTGVPSVEVDRMEQKWERDWSEAAGADSEGVGITIQPDISPYTRV